MRLTLPKMRLYRRLLAWSRVQLTGSDEQMHVHGSHEILLKIRLGRLNLRPRDGAEARLAMRAGNNAARVPQNASFSRSERCNFLPYFCCIFVNRFTKSLIEIARKAFLNQTGKRFLL